MNRKKRIRKRLRLVLAILLLLSLAALWVFRLSPTFRALTENTVINAASSALYEAVTEQLYTGTVDYTRLVLFEKDADGNITAMHTDMGQVARLKAEVFAILDDFISQIDVRGLSIPVGDLLLPEFFAGQGARLPIKVLALTTTDADFYSELTAAGMNQTLVTTSMTFSVDMVVLTALGRQNVTVESTVMLGQTVLLGQVPDTLITLGE